MSTHELYMPHSPRSERTQKPIVEDHRDLVIHLLFNELARAESILSGTGIADRNKNELLFIRSALSSCKKYITK